MSRYYSCLQLNVLANSQCPNVNLGIQFNICHRDGGWEVSAINQREINNKY